MKTATLLKILKTFVFLHHTETRKAAFGYTVSRLLPNPYKKTTEKIAVVLVAGRISSIVTPVLHGKGLKSEATQRMLVAGSLKRNEGAAEEAEWLTTGIALAQ